MCAYLCVYICWHVRLCAYVDRHTGKDLPYVNLYSLVFYLDVIKENDLERARERHNRQHDGPRGIVEPEAGNGSCTV